MKIEDKVHVALSKDDLLDVIRMYFKNSHGIDLKKIEIIIDNIPYGQYNVKDVTQVKCEGIRELENEKI